MFLFQSKSPTDSDFITKDKDRIVAYNLSVAGELPLGVAKEV